MKLYKKEGWEKKNPGFECENQMQSSGTVENLTTGFQSEMCFNCTLQCLSNYLSHGKHTSSSVLMYQTNRSFNITPRPPPGHLNFWKIFVQIPLSLSRKAVQMPPPPGELLDYCFNFR